MKKIALGTLFFALLVVLGLSVPGSPPVEAKAISGPQNPQGNPVREVREIPKIEPKADEYLKAMSTYLANLKTYSFQVEESFDEVEEDGQKIQMSNQRHLSVVRPNKVFGEDLGDSINSSFYYDGKTVSVYDRGQKTYATEKVPGTIDSMLEDLHTRFDTHQTLADFLFSDPYKMFTENLLTGTYVGLHQVGKVKCHHLAFQQKLIDWQIWIDSGDQPLPRKFLITFKRQMDEPQYSATINHWDVNPKLSDTLFQFQPSEGVRKVDFLYRHAESEARIKAGGKSGDR
ncbi:DUF2092 domain-containing protein [Telmatocola sphagniphila]|uniref:DUF2092 domain-containing protein n=1 Tax=Telmatocola sphagniphila TaxID=1123043 RepID=A0A8E6B997_9BACT|nr:DUF2092 domain-containing protein [Telmatocola sphagniphila]QVL33737.1 DUF2092 domain-containing protein [Telmatocola sphagniphila]